MFGKYEAEIKHLKGVISQFESGMNHLRDFESQFFNKSLLVRQKLSRKRLRKSARRIWNFVRTPEI